MNSLQLVSITKEYDNKYRAVHNVTLEVDEGEFLVLVGPSGCGKSTLLRMIAGLETITSGDLFFNGKRMNDIQPADRDVGMVFQNYALYPHLTVEENIGFPLSIRRQAKQEIKRLVTETAEMIGLSHLLSRKPKELSGGQRQRVALGRAIIRRPKFFLFDEPLSNLDAQLRVQMRTEIIALQRKLGVTAVYVTHDQTEAMTMGDRIAVLKNGIIQQIATPTEIYSSPENEFVAAFIGSPQINLFKGRMDSNNRSQFIENNNGCIISFVGSDPFINLLQSMSEFTIGVRSEHLIITNELSSSHESQSLLGFQATVRSVEFIGHESLVYFETAQDLKCCRTTADSPVKAGDSIRITFATENSMIFDNMGNRVKSHFT
ncbi:MAG: ABC transporter ATP-binding protein [Ignavibacteria bacterium]|nr:ABC transporter ATP-binding protein [Ignavibacteria bacterium]